MTRLGDLLHFWQLFKACDNNYFAQITHILGKLWKVVKIFNFSSEIIFWQLFLVFGDFLLVTLLICVFCYLLHKWLYHHLWLSSFGLIDSPRPIPRLCQAWKKKTQKVPASKNVHCPKGPVLLKRAKSCLFLLFSSFFQYNENRLYMEKA